MTHRPNLSIGIRWLEHFTPFHIIWNPEGERVHVSPKAARFFGLKDQGTKSKPLELIRPFRTPFNPVLFPELTNLILYVGTNDRNQQVLKGELIELDDGKGWLFSGLPPAASIAELETFGVKLSELPLHLGIGDFLLANEAARVSLADSSRTNEELRKTSDELREHSELLEHKSAQLVQEIAQHEKARETLEDTLHELQTMQGVVVQQERLKAMGEMVSGIAHDFNNLLTPITAYSSLLKTSDSVSENERREYLDLIMTAANDAAALIQRLRRLYKPDTATSAYSSFEIDRLADDALALVYPKWASRPHIKPSDIKVEKDYCATGELIGIQSDIRQALVNLLVNAADALSGSGTIRVSTGSTEEMVWVSVMDSGSGMTPTVLERSKTPFFSTKGEHGTGLGLPMVFESALRHGGRVVLESEFGKGSRMSVIFPRSQTQGDPVGIGISSSALSARIETRIGLDMTKSFTPQRPLMEKLEKDHLVSTDDSLRELALEGQETAAMADSSSANARSGEQNQGPKNDVDRVTRPDGMSSLHILIVDDDRLIRQALGRAFVSGGHRILLADDGEQALQLCETQSFDFIVCDVDMPRLRGDDFAVKLRQKRPKSIVILHTGNLDGIHAEGRTAANTILPKPTDALKILQTGTELLRARTMEQ